MNALQFPGARWWKFDFHTHLNQWISATEWKTEKEAAPWIWEFVSDFARYEQLRSE